MNRCALFGCGASFGIAIVSKNSVAPPLGTSASMAGGAFAVRRFADVQHRDRQHFRRRVEKIDAAALQFGCVLRVEDQAPGVLGHRQIAQSGLDLGAVDADRDVTPHPVDEVLVARVDGRQLFEQAFVEVAPVRELAAVELLQQAAFDLDRKSVV